MVALAKLSTTSGKHDELSLQAPQAPSHVVPLPFGIPQQSEHTELFPLHVPQSSTTAEPPHTPAQS